MKKCQQCDIAYNKGEFCSKCGQPLIEVSDSKQDTPVVESSVPNAKPKIKKKKKIVSKISIAILFLLLLVIGFALYYLNTSKNAHVFHGDGDLDYHDYIESLRCSKLDGCDIEVYLSPKIVNNFVAEHISLEQLDLPPFVSADRLYYSEEEESFIVDISGFLINSSLFFDVDVDADEKHIALMPLNFRLGNKKLPVPNQLISGGHFKKIIINQSDIVSIEKVDFEDGIYLEGEFNSEIWDDFLYEVNCNIQSDYVAYLMADAKTLAGYNQVTEYHGVEAISNIVNAFLNDETALENWLVVLDKKTSETLLDNINTLLPKKLSLNVKEMIAKAEATKRAYDGKSQQISDSLGSSLSSSIEIEQFKKVCDRLLSEIINQQDALFFDDMIVYANNREYITFKEFIEKKSGDAQLADLCHFTVFKEGFGFYFDAGYDCVYKYTADRGLTKYDSREAFEQTLVMAKRDSTVRQIKSDSSEYAKILSKMSNVPSQPLFVRYMATNDKWAYVEAYVENAKVLTCYILKKEGSDWSKRIEADYTSLFYEVNVANIMLESFNAMLLVYQDSKYGAILKNQNAQSYESNASSYLSEKLSSGGILNHQANRLYDGDYTTVWAEGVTGSSIGEWVKVTFKEHATITGIDILNGHKRRLDLFQKNAAVKSLKITFDNGEYEIFDLKNLYQTVDVVAFSKDYYTSSLKLEIIDEHKGEKWQDVCISELIFHIK